MGGFLFACKIAPIAVFPEFRFDERVSVSDNMDLRPAFCHKGKGCGDCLYVGIEIFLFSIEYFHYRVRNKSHVQTWNYLGSIPIHQIQSVSVSIKTETIVIFSFFHGFSCGGDGCLDNRIWVSLWKVSIRDDIHKVHFCSRLLEGKGDFASGAAIKEFKKDLLTLQVSFLYSG